MENVPLSSTNKKLGSNIEKSVKDLQHCTVSLVRCRVVVKEEIDVSTKKMKQAFAELQSCSTDQEVALLAERDKVKAEAMEILLSRQLLKKMTNVTVRMSEEQLVELRADIKHFVSERKYDEDLGRVAWFTCDVETLRVSIHLDKCPMQRTSHSTRSRCGSVVPVSLSCPSVGSAASSSPDASAPSLPGANKRNCASREASAAVRNSSDQPARLIRRYSQETGKEDKVTGHKAKGPQNPQIKGGMTKWVATEIARGTHPGPGIRVFHLKPQEMSVSGSALTLQGPMELEPARA